MLTARENFMRLMRCETPEYIPEFSLMWGTFFRPSCYSATRNPDNTGKDYFGVEWVTEGSAIQGALPKPGDFILDDIRKWRDVIKVPDFSKIDWEAMARKDKENHDPSMPFGGGTAPGGQGLFQALMSFMGFVEGLAACHDEPEEVKALLAYLTDWACENAKRFIYYYKPDFGSYPDDIAYESRPFVSVEMFRELFAPYWKQYIDVFLEAGIPVEHHDCGFCEPLLDEFVALGITAWDPVQLSNDVVAIKKKYGNKLALCRPLSAPAAWANAAPSEDFVRAYVKKTLDQLAPGGGLAVFMPPPPSPDADTPATPMTQYSAWVKDEFDRLKFSYYKQS